LEKDTFKVASEVLADLVAECGPLLTKKPTEDMIPGVHQSAVDARTDILSFVSRHYIRPIVIPKSFIAAQFKPVIALDRPPQPTHIIRNDDNSLSVLFSMQDRQIISKIVTPESIMSQYHLIGPSNEMQSHRLCYFKKSREGKAKIAGFSVRST
jgi:hypothetical protein